MTNDEVLMTNVFLQANSPRTTLVISPSSLVINLLPYPHAPGQVAEQPLLPEIEVNAK